MDELKSVLTIIGMLLLMVAIFAGAYWTPKLLARRWKGGNPLPDKLEIISKAIIGKDQALIIVRAVQKVFLLGVTSHSISLICELDTADFPATPVRTAGAADADFFSVLKNALKYPKSGGHGRDDLR